MHVLRFFLTSSSAATRGCAPARRCIRVLALPKQPSLRVSDSLDFRHSSTIPAALSQLSASPPSLDSISDWHSNPIAHRVRRKRQRLPPSLLIENASDRHFSSTQCVLPEAFPIKPSDRPPTMWRNRMPGRGRYARPGLSSRGVDLHPLFTECWSSSPGLERQSGDLLYSDRTERVGRRWLRPKPSLRS